MTGVEGNFLLFQSGSSVSVYVSVCAYKVQNELWVMGLVSFSLDSKITEQLHLTVLDFSLPVRDQWDTNKCLMTLVAAWM